MESKTGKESRRGDDITFLSEIITNPRQWQEIFFDIISDRDGAESFKNCERLDEP